VFNCFFSCALCRVFHFSHTSCSPVYFFCTFCVQRFFLRVMCSMLSSLCNPYVKSIFHVLSVQFPFIYFFLLFVCFVNCVPVSAHLAFSDLPFVCSVFCAKFSECVQYSVFKLCGIVRLLGTFLSLALTKLILSISDLHFSQH